MITAASNPHVKYARRLHRRRMREKEGRCLLEGVRLVADAAEAGASFVLGFWEETMLRVPGGEALLTRLMERPPLGGFFEVHPHVMAELADTEAPQGIVVVAQRPAPNPRPLLGEMAAAGRRTGPGDASAAPPVSGTATLAILDNVRDPGNVGTVIRSADASGAAGVIFLPGTADPFGSKALRASMGSTFHIPVVAAEQAVLAYKSELGDLGRRSERAEPAEDTVAGDDEDYLPRTETASHLPRLLARLGYRVFVADASAEAPHWKAPLGGKAAIVLGSEAEGPDPVLWAGADRISIPMLGPAESLNVAMAAAVLLYEAARAREGWGR
jgi:TrmH family RNA methyltransferase